MKVNHPLADYDDPRTEADRKLTLHIEWTYPPLWLWRIIRRFTKEHRGPDQP